MLKKVILTAAVAALAVFFAGCSSFRTATNLNGVKLTTDPQRTSVAHVHGEVWGIYLVGCLPIMTGSVSTPGQCSFFSDNVTIPRAVGMMTKAAQSKLDVQYLDNMETETTSWWVLPTVLCWYKSIQVSANAVR